MSWFTKFFVLWLTISNNLIIVNLTVDNLWSQILCHLQWFCKTVSRWILSIIEYLRIRKESIFVGIIGIKLSIWYAETHWCPTNFFHVKFVWTHIALSEVVIEKKSLKYLLKYYTKLIITGKVLYESIWR